ncbi:MAG TPA: 23S rRNA (uracil(1939)-C(5))-methyltransferase RlmD [Pseudogracilibacillus sp.]|nr:23S rRNA (uracil(1939)-C(5))-methyltransferase RlmD [Pseudogracilibacillus sp.]
MAKGQLPVKKNETVELVFEDLTSEGSGVGKLEGYPVFVPFGLPGERAQVKILKTTKKFAFGKLVRLLTESDERVVAPCHVYEKCGGCQLQHMSANLQAKMKYNQVVNVMGKIAHMPDVPVLPILRAEDPWRYRNKIQMPVGHGRDGSLITGFYAPRSHRIIEGMETCIIQNETGDKVQEGVRAICDAYGISAYQEREHRGELRHIIVRTAHETKDTMVILVTRTKKLRHEREIVEAIIKQFPEVKSIVHNVNSDRTNVILGRKNRTLYGTDYIVDTIGDLQFKIAPPSFFQVNPEQTKVLYDQALDFAQVTAEDVVIDAFCGIGSISIFLARQAKKVYGVEVVKEAIDNANDNAQLNHIENTEFVVGQAEEVMPQWFKDGLRPDVIVVDPPRKGCDQSALEAMIGMEPKRIVYVSCNPATLARDLSILADGGYETKKVQPVDLFPQTTHVECVSLLQRETI